MCARFDVEADAVAAGAMAAALDDYLPADWLYRRLATPGSGRLRSAALTLTIGGLLIRLHRLRARQSALTAAQAARLQQALADWQAARRRWPAHYERKLVREFGARLDTWRWFLDDCIEQPRACPDYYPAQVQTRAVVAHLRDELAALDTPPEKFAPQRDKLAALDGLLRLYFAAGDFVWEEELRPAYPQERFWFLHGRPRPPVRA